MPNTRNYEAVLGHVFDELRGSLRKDLSSSDYAVLRDTFIFHMTDWTKDLETLADLHGNPGAKDPDAMTTFIVGFLYHVIPHLKAAGRLLLDDVGDPFAEDEVYGLLARGVKSGS